MSELAPVHKRPRIWRVALRVLTRDTAGATAIEYGLVAALIVVTMIASLQGLANQTVSMWNNVSTKVQNAH